MLNLSLKPTSFLCPYCGEWHPSFSTRDLATYNSKKNALTFMCHHSFKGRTSFYFENNICHFSTESICQKARMDINFEIPLSHLSPIEDSDCYLFKVPFKSFDYVGSYGCRSCNEFLKNRCQLPKLGDTTDFVNLVITTGFNFEKEIIPTCFNKE